jgi:betaine-aldehyde dehydrogenase
MIDMSMYDQLRPFAGNAAKAHPMLIDGGWTGAQDGRILPVFNPAKRNALIAEVPRAGTADVDRAVRAASRAQPGWAATSARDRGRVLLAIAEAIEANAEALARAIAASGVAIRTLARPEARLCADLFRYFGGVASELKGETVPLGENVLSYSRREPFGVVGAITPWNAPAATAALKIAPALCAGNTVVLKASEDAPLGALALARLCFEKLPDGVLNVLTGDGPECGAALAAHPDVRKLSFTGSTATGKSIMRAAAERIAAVSLELGGKSPQIVYSDVGTDERAVEGVLAGMRFTRQTQSCSAGTRVFIHEDILEPFVAAMADRISRLKIGDPYEEETEVGAVINERQFNRICQYVEDGLRTPGARLLAGGLPPRDGKLAEGYFAVPTIFIHTDNRWRLAQEEIFGPVMVVIPWRDEADVIRMANDSHYGLAAYIWTHDIGRALRTAHAIESGWIQINQAEGQTVSQSYGGIKQSGIGSEFSLEGMLDGFTQRKVVTTNLRF